MRTLKYNQQRLWVRRKEQSGGKTGLCDVPSSRARHTHTLSASTKTCSFVASLESHKDHFNHNLPKIKLQTIGIAGKVSALLAGKNWSPKGLVSCLFVVLYGVLPGMMVLFPICTGHVQPQVLQHCFSVVRVFMDTFQSLLLCDITAKLFMLTTTDFQYLLMEVRCFQYVSHCVSFVSS